MEKKLFHEIFTVKNILLYVLKVFILFFILYFSVTTGFVLIFLFGFTIPIYAVLFLTLTYFIAKFPKSENNENKSFFKRHIFMPLMLLIGVGVMFLGLVLMNTARDKLEVISAHHFIKNSEEIIEYNTNTIYVGGIMETDYKHELILIDYDTMTVGFLHHPYASAELTKIKLKNKTPVQNQNVQCEYELSSPGAKITTFYPDSKNKHRTIAIEIEMADGSYYSIDNLKDEAGHTMFLGLR